MRPGGFEPLAFRVGVLRQPAKYDVHTLFLFIVLRLAGGFRTGIIDVAPFKIVGFLKTPQ